MAVTLRNSFPTAAIGAGGGSVNKPTGTQAGDLLLLEVVTSEDVVPSPPAGFVLVPGAEITGLNALRIYQKIATSAEPDDYFVYTHSSGGNAGMVAIAPSTLAYAAVHQVATASSDTASSNKVWNGVTNTDADTVLLCFGSFGSNAASTPDAAMTERWDASATRHYLMTQAVPATGATGTRTATGTSVARQRCITISVTETATKPFELPDEIQVTALPALVEVEGEGVQVTALPALVELGAVGIYLTELAVLVEIEVPVPCRPRMRVRWGAHDLTNHCHAAALEQARVEKPRKTLGSTALTYRAGLHDSMTRLRGDWSPALDQWLGVDARRGTRRAVRVTLNDCLAEVVYEWAQAFVAEWHVFTAATGKIEFVAAIRHIGPAARSIRAQG